MIAKISIHLFLLMLTLVLAGCATLPGEPERILFDPNHPDYIVPEVAIIRAPAEYQILADDAVTIEWEGSQDFMEFRYRLDNGYWTDFTAETSVSFDNLSNGFHFFNIEGRYPTSAISPTLRRSFFVDQRNTPALSIYSWNDYYRKNGSFELELRVIGTVPINEINLGLTFDPTILKADSVIFYTGEESFLLQNSGTLANAVQIDNVGGAVQIGHRVMDNNPQDIFGSGRIAIVKFTHISATAEQAFISISPDSHLKNSDNAVIQLNELGSVQVYFL